jgi:hypothetical protein
LNILYNSVKLHQREKKGEIKNNRQERYFMDSKLSDERIRIFRKELLTLEKEGYLPENIVETVAKAHHLYYIDLLQTEAAQQATSIKVEPLKQEKVANKKPQKIKRKLAPEEIRERNITWSLNIGVIFLLIGGLFVATSNWQTMSSFMKSGLIALVAILFFGLAFLTKKVLHIEKTAFAFTVLGSLFLPIFILSLGWFGLLGSYLSINGEGRYFLGTLGSMLPIIAYVWFARNLESRLFVWFTFVSITGGVAFFLAGIHQRMDSFYLCLMFLNIIYILLYNLIKKRNLMSLFTKEFVPFIQVNLVLCTLFMLFLYDNQMAHSFNLFLTAVIYLAMIYVSGKKEYHFVFSLMIVYASYQLFEHSNFKTFSAIGYAMIGFGVVFVPKLLKREFSLDKTFQVTSAVISGLTFIYITFEGMLLRDGQSSIILMIAYFVVAANFIYLTNNLMQRLFSYLSTVFLAAALYEAVTLILKPIDVIHFPMSLFLTGFILLIIFGILLITKHVKNIQRSAKNIGLAIMGMAVLTGIAFSNWWELGIMLMLLLFASYLIYKKDTRPIFKEAALWILPSALGLSLTAFGEEVNSQYPGYTNQFGEAVNLAAGAIVVLLSSFGWKKVKEVQLSRISFFVSQILYSISIVQAIGGSINEEWVQPLILIFGVGMYTFLFKKIGAKWVPFLISITAFVSYFSIIHSISMKFELNHTINSLIASTGAILMLMIAYLFLKKDLSVANGFAWTGNVFYPITLAYTYFAFHYESILSFFPGVVVYGLSAMFTRSEWKIKVYLYGSFTSLLFAISTGMDRLDLQSFGYYVFPFTSALIFIFYIFTGTLYRKRTTYYIVPFSFLGIFSVLITYPFSWEPFMVAVFYSVGILIFLHSIKWDIFSAIPLFFAFLATAELSFFTVLPEEGKLLLTGGMGTISAFIGSLTYKQLVNGNSIKRLKIDTYTATSFLYFLLMYYFENDQIWTKGLPGILISVAILLQSKRVPERYSQLTTILGAFYLLQPYYSMMIELNIPALWEREVLVLPWIAIIIFIRIKLKAQYTYLTKLIEWGILITVSLALIQDGLSSSTIYDAIILGTLSLISMLVGMFIQIKSYFFVGSAVLLLNVFLQTRPYWGNMPWWGYLLIVGFILIAVASFNEWNKQKISKGETTFIMTLKDKTINKLKHWD